MIAALAFAVLVYTDVPPEVERVSVYQWRAGSAPAPIDVSPAREGARVTLALPAGAMAIVMLQRRDGAYLLDGPVAIADARIERRLDEVWRSTIQGGVAGDPAGAAGIAWLAADGTAGDRWPACWWTTVARWECHGVPIGAAGVVLAPDGHRLWSAAIRGRSAAQLTPSSWGRLLLAGDRGDGALPRLTARIARPLPPPRRPKSVRVDTAALADVRTTRLGSSAIWIAGDSLPPSAWVDIRSARSGPAYLSLADVAEGPPDVPVRVLLDTRSVAAAVVSDRGEPVAAALVTIFRLVDPLPAPGAREPPPRRVWISETVADLAGTLRLDGLGDGVYEIVAWHTQLGRGSLLLPAGADRVTIRVLSPGIARGRVLAGGTPAAGVEVTVVPDPSALALAEDFLDLKGGDARSGVDGRFAVTLAPGGGGEVRVGGGPHPIRRLPLPSVRMPIVELGDIDLGRGITLSIALDQDPGCDLRAAGPIGRAGLRIVTATRTGPGLFSMTLPEEGSWEFGLVCGRDERALAPAVVRVTDHMPPLTFSVR